MSHCASVLDFFASLLLVPRKNCKPWRRPQSTSLWRDDYCTIHGITL